MSTDRHEEPAVLHALEQVQEALRAEQRAEEPLSRENARLRARFEQLRAERDQLQRAVEEPGDEQSPRAPRLPEALEPPFVVQTQAFPRPQARWFLPTPVLVLLMLAVGEYRNHRAQMFNGILLLGVVAYQGVKFWWRRWRARCRFDTDDFECGGWEGTRGPVSYSNVLSVEVYVSASQRRRGVGTLVVTYKSRPWAPATLCVQLKDVPEPERLAAWLQAKR